MPSKDQHRDQATKNELLFQSFDLNDTPYLDWAVVALFYAALHWVEAYLATVSDPIGPQNPRREGGHHAGGHSQRYNKVLSSPDLSPIRREYRELMTRSEEARYNCWDPPPDFVSSLATGEYEAIKNHISPLLAPATQ